MVTSDSNRTQTPTTPSYERPTQPFSPPTEAVAPAAQVPGEQPRAEEGGLFQLREPFWFTSMVVAGATIGGMWGLSAMVLSIIGLSSVLPAYMLPVAGIVLGAAFVTLGGVGLAWARMFRFRERQSSRDRIVFFSGVAAVSITGIAAIVLSILNLVFLAGAQFTSVTVIVLGLGLLWHSRVMHQLNRYTYQGEERRHLGGPLAIDAVSLAQARDMLLGIAGVILGVLGVLNIAPMVLGFVALLALGGGLTLTISTICGATLATLKGMCSRA